MVTYKSGGINFRYYNKMSDTKGSFTTYHADVIAWDYKPEPYKGDE